MSEELNKILETISGVKESILLVDTNIKENDEKLAKFLEEQAQKDEKFAERLLSVEEIVKNHLDATRKRLNVDLKNIDGLTPTGDPQSKEARLNDWLKGATSAKYRQFSASPETKAALEGGTDSEGGFLVPEEFRPEVIREILGASVIMAGAFHLPMGTDTLNLPRLLTDVTVAVADEEAGISESEPTFERPSLTAKKIAAYGKMSTELIEDSKVPLQPLLVTLYGQKISAKIDTDGFNATAQATEIGTGILQATGVNETVMSAGLVNFSDIHGDDLITAQFSLKTFARKSAKWYMHRTIFEHIRKLTDDSGKYIFADLANGSGTTLLGDPYVLVEDMPTNSDSAVDTPFIAYGNLNPYFYVGDKGEVRVASDNGIVNFTNDQTLVKVTMRLGILVALPSAFARVATPAA
jgi:HK97 family phage major capsid protein